jgi:transcriptional regulator with XRE-family HTH domain
MASLMLLRRAVSDMWCSFLSRLRLVDCSMMLQLISVSVTFQSLQSCSTITQQVCHDALMPSIDEGAKAFETNLAQRFGFALSTRRKALKVTASEVSRRTAELGYPISRGAIAKIESNSRSGKVDVAEVLVLSAALEIPPLLLLFPGFATDGGAEIVPGVFTKEDEAVRWMSGQVSFPQEYDIVSMRLEDRPNPPNAGVNLIAATSLLEEALETRISLVHHLSGVQDDPVEAETSQRMLERNSEQIEAIRKRRREAQAALWGYYDNYDPPETDSDD